jgi:GTPase SAR1 family protein
MDATITITGLPGAGKKTLRDSLVREYGGVAIIEIIEMRDENVAYYGLTGFRILLVCFDAGDEDALQKTYEWIGELARIPYRVLLVATKADTIDENHEDLLREKMISHATRSDITCHFVSASDRGSVSRLAEALRPHDEFLAEGRHCCSTG